MTATYFLKGWIKIPALFVENGREEYKGVTADGNPLYQTEFFDKYCQRHVSYCTVVVNGHHQYVRHSGRERGQHASAYICWDPGPYVTWQEALNRRSVDLV